MPLAGQADLLSLPRGLHIAPDLEGGARNELAKGKLAVFRVEQAGDENRQAELAARAKGLTPSKGHALCSPPGSF